MGWGEKTPGPKMGALRALPQGKVLGFVLRVAQEETDGLRRKIRDLGTSTSASFSQMIKWQWINLTERE